LESFLRKARELADRYNALLVFDEIQCGVDGPLLRYQLYDTPILPDVTSPRSHLRAGLPPGRWCDERNGLRRRSRQEATGRRLEAFHWHAGWRWNSSTFFRTAAFHNSSGSYFRMRLQELQQRFAFIKESARTRLDDRVELIFQASNSYWMAGARTAV